MPKILWMFAAACLWLGTDVAVFGAGVSSRFTVDVWDTDKGNGLPQNSIISMVQTRDGYLWVGTLNGLARFDGIRFTTFSEYNTPGLNSGRIVKLFEDTHGNLWIGTDTAGVFVVRNGKVGSLGIGRGVPEGQVVSICEDPAGAVWLYTADGQLGRYENEELVVWRVGPSKCRSMIVDDSGLVWIGTDFTLSAVRPTAGLNGSEFPPLVYGAAVAKLDLLLASKQGGYWRLAEGRIQKWNGDRLERDLGPYPWNPTNTPVKVVCEDQQGNLIAGTGGEGVFWFDAAGNYVQLAADDNGLSQNTVLSLCIDREGDLWVGTDGGGLNRVKRQIFGVLEGTGGSTVQSVCEDGHGGLWIGCFGPKIDHWNGGELEHYSKTEGLEKLGVKSVFVDRDQKVWAGTQLGGLLQLQGGRFLQAPQYDSLSLSRDPEICAIYQDRTNRIWVGGQSGLACWDGQDWRLFTVRDGLSANFVRALAEDGEGNLWIGTEGGGLNRMHDGHFDWFGRTNGLPSDNIRSLLFDRDGVLWTGTSRGLARFQDGKWISYAGRLPSASGSVGYLLDDAQGYLWIGTTSGLMRARKKDLDDLGAGTIDSVPVRTYSRLDGLPTGECSQGSQPAACRTQDGKLWFPTIKGLASVNPALLSSNTNPPPVIIESVKIDGVLQGASTLRAAPLLSVTVPSGKEGLEIDYTSINLSAPDKGRFKYRLQGFEEGWTYVNAERPPARYPKLPPGSYTFQVTACNEDGVWNPTAGTLAVVVQPAFWQTRWFLALVTLALLGAIVGSVHFVSTQKLQRQLALLRQQEALERERARIARDLHDQLGANLTQVALLGEMAEADKQQPAEVETHARQICQTAREITRALDEIVWTVNPSNDTLDGLVNYICKYAQDYLALAGLRYRLEIPPTLPTTPISPELRHNVFLAAKEAVNNVVKHAQASAVHLRLQLEPDRFTLEVEDDGRGLDSGAGTKGRNGLRNMRKRMEDIGGEFQIGPVADHGTRVRLTAFLNAPHNFSKI